MIVGQNLSHSDLFADTLLKSMLRSKTLELRLMNKRAFGSDVTKEKLNGILSKPIFTRSDMDNIEALRLQLAKAEEQEIETLRIKAGVKWREDGERSTRYFLGRFKSRAGAATMHVLNAGRQVISGSTDLVNFVKIFYSRLYNAPEPEKVTEQQFINDFFSNCPRLEIEHRTLLARPLTLDELKAALKTCQDSAPGMDGIPYSFYKSFPDPLLELLLQSWNHALHTGELAPSHRRSCLTLLPKKGKDLSLLGNWRPISLSACDLKIITKAYANRLKLVLPSILCESQAAYVPGRDISFNNRLLNLAKIYARTADEDFCVVSLDAKKAFDSVSHSYLVKVLNAYDFPKEFIQVFQTLYSNLESVVQVNGHLSTPFGIKNGVKQGDALSCGLFVLAMDPLLRNIISNESIEGMLIPSTQHDLEEIKVLAYADDVTIICRNANLQPLFDEYERLTLVSGLALNADKTEIFNFTQSQVNHDIIRYLGADHMLGRVAQITICGMCIATEEAVEYRHNVLKRIDTMEGIITSWGRRQLTMNGRMLLAKSFLLSQIVFPAQFTQICNNEIKKIERLIYAFVNGSRNLYGPEHVARKYLKADRSEGGINGVDVRCFVTAIALRQFGKALQLHRTLKALQSSVTATRDDISKIALSQLKLSMVTFLRNHPLPDIQDLEVISSAPLNLFLSPTSDAAGFANQYGITDLFSVQRELAIGRLPRPRINCIVRRLPQQLARLIRGGNLLNIEPKYSLVTSTDRCDLTSTKVIKQALTVHVQANQAVDLNKIHRRQDLPAGGSAEFADLYKNIWAIKQPALRAIRLKLCFKDVYSNERRHRFGISDSPLCSICGQVETVEHQLFDCDNAQRLWRMFENACGSSVQSFREVILCSDRIEVESLKSTIIKALIQIDRSHNLPVKAVAQSCAHFLRIEAIVNKSHEGPLLALINGLNRV